MRRQELGHPEGAEPFVPKDLGHLLIRRHVALVVRVLQVVLLEVGPNLLDALRAGGLILADDVSEVVGELERLLESFSFRHFDLFRDVEVGSGKRLSKGLLRDDDC